MRTLLVAVLAVALVGSGGALRAQVLEKAAPADLDFALTRQHRVGMTHARRIEVQEGDRADVVREINELANAVDAAVAAIDGLGQVAGSAYAAQVEAVRTHDLAAQKQAQALKGMVDRPNTAAARAAALAAREQLDQAEDAHKALMKAMTSPRPDTAQPPAAAGR
jgi:hypothetical protein